MTRIVLLLAGIVLATGCSGPAVLGEEASCPGPTCTDDAQEMLDAIAVLDRVTGVEQVSRSYGFDRGAFHAAQLEADVSDADQAREVALEVLAALDAWPGHDPVSAEATVRADPPVVVTGVAHEREEVPPYYEPCKGGGCSDELAAVRERLSAELDGVAGLVVEVTGARLLITGRAEPEQAELAARGALRVLDEQAVAFADRVEVSFSYRMPLEVTWRLVEDRACEQPPGEAMVSCDEENSIPLQN